MKVRVFAGQGFAESYDSYEAMVTDGYEKGVPMGGDYTGERAAAVSRLGDEGPDRAEPRPHPDHQGLGTRTAR